jgi:hypothetical protein
MATSATADRREPAPVVRQAAWRLAQAWATAPADKELDLEVAPSEAKPRGPEKLDLPAQRTA